MTALAETIYQGPYAEPADREALERAAAALTEHGMDARILPDAAAVHAAIDALIADGQMVYTTTSKTLDQLGITDEVRNATRYRATRSPDRNP